MFSPVSWASPLGIAISQLRQDISHWQNEDNDILRLSLYDLEATVWDSHAEQFYTDYALSQNELFWSSWRQEDEGNWRSRFSSTLIGNTSEREVYMLLDDSWIGNTEIFEFFKVYCSFKVGLQNFEIFQNRYDYDDDLIFFLRLEIVRNECDCLGGPELIPISTASSWYAWTFCTRYSERLRWFFSIIDYKFWFLGSNFDKQKFKERM